MRFGLGSWLVLSAAAAVACAAPVVPPSSAKAASSADPALRAEAERYASQLADAINKIESDYVRPVSRVDLAEAALAGLYEAARQPVPTSLRAEVTQGVQQDLRGLLFRVRERLGACDALREEKAVLASLEALPRVLDPYCGPTGRSGLRGLDISDSTPNTGLEFVGVPLLLTNTVVVTGVGRPIQSVPFASQLVPAGPLRVQGVQPGSPGQRAGVRPGDLITRLNGRPPESPEFSLLFQQLRPVQTGLPHSPTPVRLTVVRAGRPEPFDVAVTSAPYRPESVYGARRRADGSWDYVLDPADRIGYIRLDGIRKGPRPTDEDHYGSHQEFRDALRSLDGSGVRGLLLDVRWCPGGYLTEAATISRLLLPARFKEGSAIAWQRDRLGEKRAVDFEVLDRFYTEFPVVVLVNGETSGGGELISAALQDFGRAAIAGQRTRGKGSVQTEGRVAGLQFKLTSWLLLRSNEKNLQRFSDSKAGDDWGVRPDEGRELALTPEAGRRLKEWWTLQTLRPPADVEALPLDDPENDPQRLAALQMLRAMLKK